jgi:nicotinate phosphoribosyltransferase
MSTTESQGSKTGTETVAERVRAELRPRVDEITAYTDTYFNKTRDIVGKFGDTQVTYAVFMRRPVISAARLALDWLEDVAEARGTKFKIDLRFDEGRWVGAGEPLMYISGSFHELVDLETLFLQKLGAACVAAYNAAAMASTCPMWLLWLSMRATALARIWLS